LGQKSPMNNNTISVLMIYFRFIYLESTNLRINRYVHYEQRITIEIISQYIRRYII
jgi:hypothetical protein